MSDTRFGDRPLRRMPKLFVKGSTHMQPLDIAGGVSWSFKHPAVAATFVVNPSPVLVEVDSAGSMLITLGDGDNPLGVLFAPGAMRQLRRYLLEGFTSNEELRDALQHSSEPAGPMPKMRVGKGGEVS